MLSVELQFCGYCNSYSKTTVSDLIWSASMRQSCWLRQAMNVTIALITNLSETLISVKTLLEREVERHFKKQKSKHRNRGRNYRSFLFQLSAIIH